tara:strand:- start:124 stop:288 length:165 start_codon:yes stop_codon:yes gene_type:complete
VNFIVTFSIRNKGNNLIVLTDESFNVIKGMHDDEISSGLVGCVYVEEKEWRIVA